jgi:hypothetical protein
MRDWWQERHSLQDLFEYVSGDGKFQPGIRCNCGAYWIVTICDDRAVVWGPQKGVNCTRTSYYPSHPAFFEQLVDAMLEQRRNCRHEQRFVY